MVRLLRTECQGEMKGRSAARGVAAGAADDGRSARSPLLLLPPRTDLRRDPPSGTLASSTQTLRAGPSFLWKTGRPVPGAAVLVSREAWYNRGRPRSLRWRR